MTWFAWSNLTEIEELVTSSRIEGRNGSIFLAGSFAYALQAPAPPRLINSETGCPSWLCGTYGGHRQTDVNDPNYRKCGQLHPGGL
jgi:hypothetical protein